MTDAERVEVLQRMIDRFVDDVTAMQAASADTRVPEGARRALAAALVYVVDRFDLVPDHIDGLGAADDAAVIRLAAKNAVSYGANDAGVRRLAAEAADLTEIWTDLLLPLEDYLNRLQWQAADGKTPAEIIGDAESRVKLWRELGQRLKSYKTAPLVGTRDATEVLKTLRKLVRARLQKIGLVRA
jgi:uncharacterized membrane protein YkvA (DUF1232 family)